jgi:hypothetical protein
VTKKRRFRENSEKGNYNLVSKQMATTGITDSAEKIVATIPEKLL